MNFQATAKNVVRTGERFNLIYTLNAEGSGFRGPQIENFRVLSGPSSSQSSSIQIINGKVSQSVELTFTYLLSAGNDEGLFEIPPAKVNLDGKTYESNAVKIQVVKGDTQSQQGTQQGTQNQGSTGTTQDTENLKDDVFVRAVVNKTNPYQGEQIVVTYKLYFRINVSAPDFIKEPSFKGFWVSDLMRDRKSYLQYTETYNGQQYNVAELKKAALFPQRSGDIVIDPVELNIQAQVRAQNQQRSRDPFFDNFFNDPFFNRYRTVEVPLTSNGLKINVKALPTSNKPANFSGGVGDFNFSSSIDKTQLKANEALNLKFTVSGTGNVELIDRINVTFPPDFEVYDPKVTKNINTTQNGVSGSKTFEYLIIPRNPGKFTIDKVNFSYFDLKSKQYKILTSPEYNIDVEKGEGTATNISYSGVNQADIKYIGSDIRFIRTMNPDLRIVGSYFFGSGIFYILLILPVILFIAFTIIWKNELKKRSNIALMRNRKATKVAKKRMKKAQGFLKENKKDEFYVEVSQALWGYLSDKFSIPLSNLSMTTVSETLQQRDVDENTLNRFIDTLNNCEFARFAPGDSTVEMEKIYIESVNIISKMESELK
ncbi:MAG: protein BatD [Bacteroidales bacterium]|nr:protein BatD [Bacteroidales bacterium]